MDALEVLSSAESARDSQSCGQSGFSHSLVMLHTKSGCGSKMNDFDIKRLLEENKLEEIILGMLPIAKRIGYRFGVDAYSVAVECLVEKVQDLRRLGHDNYVKYLAKCMKGRVYTFRCHMGVVSVPETFFRELKKLGREKELQFEFVDYDNIDERYDDYIEIINNDILELVEKELTIEEATIMRGRMCGFTDEEIALEIGKPRSSVQAIRVMMNEKILKLLHKFDK